MTGNKRTWIVVVVVLALGTMSCCTCTGLWAVASRQSSMTPQAVTDEGSTNGVVSDQRLSAAIVDTPTAAPVLPAEAAPPADTSPGSGAVDAGGTSDERDPAPDLTGGGPVADLQALGAYAQSIKPLLDQGLAAAERDGELLKAGENQPELLCGDNDSPHPQLEADAALMHDLVRQLNAMSPPPEARVSVHEPLTESARLWGTALDNVNDSCRKDPLERGVMRLGAAVQLGSSMLSFRVAYDNFWRLALANGLEALVGPAP